MPGTTASSDGPAKNRRLEQLLQQLADQGATQQQVARQLNVPPSYLSDVKLGRKTLSEQFARSFCNEFGVGLDWLLDGTGPQTKPQLASTASSAGPVLVPILAEPIVGDPQDVRAWDGSRVELAGAAATRAIRAYQSYVLRSPIDDKQGRIRQNDLLLIDQDTTELTSVVVVRDRENLVLARLTEKRFRAIDSGRVISGSPSVVGICVGIVWAGL